MALIIMIPILLICLSDGWQTKDNVWLIITIVLTYLNYLDAIDTESDEYYGGY